EQRPELILGWQAGRSDVRIAVVETLVGMVQHGCEQLALVAEVVVQSLLVDLRLRGDTICARSPKAVFGELTHCRVQAEPPRAIRVPVDHTAWGISLLGLARHGGLQRCGVDPRHSWQPCCSASLGIHWTVTPVATVQRRRRFPRSYRPQPPSTTITWP